MKLSKRIERNRRIYRLCKVEHLTYIEIARLDRLNPDYVGVLIRKLDQERRAHGSR